LAPERVLAGQGCGGTRRAEVKEVVWHEVAHWLGHDEEQVKDLGLSTLSLPVEDSAFLTISPPTFFENFLRDKSLVAQIAVRSIDELL
jgi:hypothetical protein